MEEENSENMDGRLSPLNALVMRLVIENLPNRGKHAVLARLEYFEDNEWCPMHSRDFWYEPTKRENINRALSWAEEKGFYDDGV